MDTFKHHFFFTSILTLLLFVYTQSKEPLTATIMHSMHRPSGYVLSPDKKYIAFSDRVWSQETGKFKSFLKYFDINNPSIIYDITNPSDVSSDVMPSFSNAFKQYIFFMRNGQIYYKNFPPKSASEKEYQLTNYPISINDYKIKNNGLVFSAKLYFECVEGDILTCSKNLSDIRNTQNYGVYTQLKMFDWDKWEDEGKGNHIFYHKLKLNSDATISLVNKYPKDLTKGMKVNSPPYDCGSEMYDISNDGTMVAFTAHLRDHNEAFTTTWKTFIVKYVDQYNSSIPYEISSSVHGRTANPRFNKDNTKLAFLGMKRPFLESDLLELYIYNINTNVKSYIKIDEIDTSISDYFWYKDNEIIFNSIYYQFHTIFHVNILNPEHPVYTIYHKSGPSVSYNHIVSVIYASKGNNYIITSKVGYDIPECLIKIDITNKKEILLLDLNQNIKKNHELVPPEEFQFVGGDNETVHGFVFKPINYEKGKKYPTVLLIHGGPESAWISDWSFRWNPQLFTNNGFAVVMINPHGSVGFGVKFMDRVRNNWGGTPYDDFMKGMNYTEEKFDFIDKTKECAAGGSYGGYSVNWIQGHTKRFKCLINHDGVFSISQMHYSSDDLFFLKAEMCPQNKKNCNPFDDPEIKKKFELWSPERFVKNWATPMLVIHGGTDYRVPLTEALATFTALQLKKIPSKFLFMTKENHWTVKPENSIKWYHEVLAWCDLYIK